MKRLSTLRSATLLIGVATLIAPTAGAVSGTDSTTTPTTTANKAVAQTAEQQQRLQVIQSKGAQEIDRRIVSLNTLSAKINAASKLTSSDKAALVSEVSTEISGLTALKVKLAAETTIDGAKVDAQSIINDYRVYALITPKINLIKTADDQQVFEAKIVSTIAALQTNVTNAKNAGKDVTALQAQLDVATAKEQAAQTISSTIQAKVIGLQPTDYNSDHTILSGDRAQLTAAHLDLVTAVTSVKAVRDGLKSL